MLCSLLMSQVYGDAETLLSHQDYGPFGANPAIYAVMLCAALVLITGVHGLIVARKKRDRLMHAVLLHVFVLIAVISVAVISCLVELRYSLKVVETAGFPDPKQLALDQSFIAMNGIRFAVVVGVGAVLGGVALLIKRSPESQSP